MYSSRSPARKSAPFKAYRTTIYDDPLTAAMFSCFGRQRRSLHHEEVPIHGGPSNFSNNQGLDDHASLRQSRKQNTIMKYTTSVIHIFRRRSPCQPTAMADANYPTLAGPTLPDHISNHHHQYHDRSPTPTRDAQFDTHVPSIIDSPRLLEIPFDMSPAPESLRTESRSELMERQNSCVETTPNVPAEPVVATPETPVVTYNSPYARPRHLVHNGQLIPCEQDPNVPAASYIAISYTWDVNPTYVRKWDRRVTKQALEIIERLASRTKSPLWIDAICIPQDDTKAKQAELLRMTDICRGAAEVWCLIETVDQNVCAIVYAFSKVIEEGRVADSMRNGTGRLVLLYYMPHSSHVHVERLFLHRWWERAWTFQEATLNPNTFLVGDDGHRLPILDALKIAQLAQNAPPHLYGEVIYGHGGAFWDSTSAMTLATVCVGWTNSPGLPSLTDCDPLPLGVKLPIRDYGQVDSLTSPLTLVETVDHLRQSGLLSDEIWDLLFGMSSGLVAELSSMLKHDEIAEPLLQDALMLIKQRMLPDADGPHHPTHIPSGIEDRLAYMRHARTAPMAWSHYRLQHLAVVSCPIGTIVVRAEHVPSIRKGPLVFALPVEAIKKAGRSARDLVCWTESGDLPVRACATGLLVRRPTIPVDMPWRIAEVV